MNIDELLEGVDYAPLFSLDKTIIQIYFDAKCQEDNTAKVELLLTLFPQMEITNALMHSYRNNMQNMFTLLCSKIHRNPISSNKNIAQMLIEDCYEFTGKNPSMCIFPELLSELIRIKLCDCDQLLVISANIYNAELAYMTFELSTEAAKIGAFKISYLNGYYPIAKLCYDYIRCNRIEITELFDYCPSGEIIKMLAFQEFYNWKTQLINSIANRNHHAVEMLLHKIPRHTMIEFSIIADLLECATDALLVLVCSKFLIKDIDKKVIYLTMRKPILDYMETRSYSSDWLIV